MKTFWVVQRIPDSMTDHLNPLQRNQYELRRQSAAVGMTAIGIHSPRNRFHSAPNISGTIHGHRSLVSSNLLANPSPPRPVHAPPTATTVNSTDSTTSNGSVYNFVVASPCISRRGASPQGIRRSLTPGPDEWPEAEQALGSPSELSSSKDLDSPVSLSAAVQILQHQGMVDPSEVQLELASLKLSGSPYLAEITRRLMTHAKETQSLADALLHVLLTKHQQGSQEHQLMDISELVHEEMPATTSSRPSHTIEIPPSPGVGALTTLSPIKECNTEEADMLQSSVDVEDRERNAIMSVTTVEEAGANQDVGKHQLDMPAGIYKLANTSQKHQPNIQTGVGNEVTNPFPKKQQENETGAGTSTRKLSGNQPSADVTIGQRYHGSDSSVDMDEDNSQSGCTVM